MSKSITQDMAYRQSLMQYAEKYGVGRASRKYNRNRSFLYFWKKRWDGSVASLADFEKQLAVHNRRSNNLPMRPLHWLPPSQFLV